MIIATHLTRYKTCDRFKQVYARLVQPAIISNGKSCRDTIDGKVENRPSKTHFLKTDP